MTTPLQGPQRRPRAPVWVPPPLRSVADTGLNIGILQDLAIKILYFGGYLSGNEIAAQMHPRPVVLRTFDLGGDKFLSLQGSEPAAGLGGLRAIRLCLRREDVFRVQP